LDVSLFCAIRAQHKDRFILGSFVAAAVRRGVAALDIYSGARYQGYLAA
jgi:hypothetical protein